VSTQTLSRRAAVFSTSVDRRRRSIIGLTPLIDVVFILLIFFMLASSFLDWRAIPLEVPQTGVQSESETRAMLVRIQRDGGLDLNGVPVTAAGLVQQLSQRLRSPEMRVLVQPQSGVPLQDVVSILDRLNRAGVQNISLIKR